eukprot:1160766-Pelagomonas_calceolata.AAC.18
MVHLSGPVSSAIHQKRCYHWSGPMSLVLAAGQKVTRLPPQLECATHALIWPWDEGPGLARWEGDVYHELTKNKLLFRTVRVSYAPPCSGPAVRGQAWPGGKGRSIMTGVSYAPPYSGPAMRGQAWPGRKGACEKKARDECASKQRQCLAERFFIQAMIGRAICHPRNVWLSDLSFRQCLTERFVIQGMSDRAVCHSGDVWQSDWTFRHCLAEWFVIQAMSGRVI